MEVSVAMRIEHVAGVRYRMPVGAVVPLPGARMVLPGRVDVRAGLMVRTGTQSAAEAELWPFGCSAEVEPLVSVFRAPASQQAWKAVTIAGSNSLPDSDMIVS
jgi:hypothetical protein